MNKNKKKEPKTEDAYIKELREKSFTEIDDDKRVCKNRQKRA